MSSGRSIIGGKIMVPLPVGGTMQPTRLAEMSGGMAPVSLYRPGRAGGHDRTGRPLVPLAGGLRSTPIWREAPPGILLAV